MSVEVNKNGTNKNIKANILSEKEMRRVGFTDHAKDKWFFFRMLNGVPNISFNVTISKNDEKDLSIDVLDENFLQPYDYQYMLKSNPDFAPALIVKEEVEKWMKHLENNGVLSGHNYGDYI